MQFSVIEGAAMTMKPATALKAAKMQIEMGFDGTDFYINLGGHRVAVRDPDNGRFWISEPGYEVRDVGGYPPTSIEIEHGGDIFELAFVEAH
jgi:hypothetical protein